jgi:hypothetical protein
MDAKLFFLTGVAGLGIYMLHTARNYDPAVAPYSKAEVQQMLLAAKVSLPRRDGDGTIRIWSTSSNKQGVGMAMKYAEADWAPEIGCQAVITELDEKQSRVVANCGSTDGSSAIGDTSMALREPMFDEFIQSTLEKRPFDRSHATSKEISTVMKNLPKMQHEALRASDEAQRMRAEEGDQSSGDEWAPDTDRPAGG